MPLIEAALAFAITMLALSLVCSSFVEIIHRTFKLREQGLQYMLGQLFDQVLAKYVRPLAAEAAEAVAARAAQSAAAAAARLNPPGAPAAAAATPVPTEKDIEDAFALVRQSFITRMTANRAPVGLAADQTLAASEVVSAGVAVPKLRLGNIWGGRRITSLSPLEFMERLGSIDVGEAIANAANEAEKTVAGSADAILKDIAQKFEGYGSDAATYFEGRARFMSVIVAIVVAFAAHVDAIDLFKTYLRDPNARAKVIEQSEAVTAQYKAARDAMETVRSMEPSLTAPSPEDVKKQVEALRKDALDTMANAKETIRQYAELGVPLGWTTERLTAADMAHLVWTCPSVPAGGWPTPWGGCARQDRSVWFQIPTVTRVWVYLFLGGLLVGLGAPFWYDAVTGLTNIRNAGSGSPAPQAAAAPVVASHAQPVTPVGNFKVADAARAARVGRQ